MKIKGKIGQSLEAWLWSRIFFSSRFIFFEDVRYGEWRFLYQNKLPWFCLCGQMRYFLRCSGMFCYSSMFTWRGWTNCCGEDPNIRSCWCQSDGKGRRAIDRSTAMCLCCNRYIFRTDTTSLRHKRPLRCYDPRTVHSVPWIFISLMRYDSSSNQAGLNNPEQVNDNYKPCDIPELRKVAI